MRHEAGQFTTNVTLTAGDSLSQRLAFRGSGRPGSRGGTGRRRRSSIGAATGRFGRSAERPDTHLALRQFIDLSLISALGRFHDAQDSMRAVRRAQCDDPARSGRDRRHSLSAGPAKPKRRIDHARWPTSRSNSTGRSGPGSRSCRWPTTSLRRCAPECWCRRPTTRAARRSASTSPGPTISRPRRCGTTSCSREPGWGLRLTASANLFYYDMHDAQRAKPIDITGPAGFRSRLRRPVQCPQGAQLWARGGGRLAAEQPPLVTLLAGAARTRELTGLRTDMPSSTAINSAARRISAPRQRSIGTRLRASGFRHRSGTTVPISATTGTARARWCRPRRSPMRAPNIGCAGSRCSLMSHNLFDNFAFVERDANFAVLEDPREVAAGIETALLAECRADNPA